MGLKPHVGREFALALGVAVETDRSVQILVADVVGIAAGVIGLAKTLSLEIAADNITINTICPGRIRTERLDKVYGKLAKDAGKDVSTLYADLAKEVPLKRLGEPDDIAGIVAFLVSNYGGYITGTTTAVDGGRRTSLL